MKLFHLFNIYNIYNIYIIYNNYNNLSIVKPSFNPIPSHEHFDIKGENMSNIE